MMQSVIRQWCLPTVKRGGCSGSRLLIRTYGSTQPFCAKKTPPPPPLYSSSGGGSGSAPASTNMSTVHKAAATELTTIFDIYRYAVSVFTRADLTYGHSTMTPWEDASFLILHELHLPYHDPILHWKDAKLTLAERQHLVSLIHRRVETRLPTPYLVQGCYQQDEYFYIDTRALIPRSFIGDLLRHQDLLRVEGTKEAAAPSSSPASPLELDYNDYMSEIVDEEKFQISSGHSQSSNSKGKTKKEVEKWVFQHDKIHSVLDLCTGSACLAILAAKYFPNIQHIDAVDISADTLEVARINVEMKGMEELIQVYEGDLYEALPTFYSGDLELDIELEQPSDKKKKQQISMDAKDKKDKTLQSFHQNYDLIISNPPYVTTEDMEYLPEEYRHEPSLALVAGKDGLSVVSKILQRAYEFLQDGGGLLCEVGQCKPALEKKYKELFGRAHEHGRVRWLATPNSKDEVFYIKKEFLHPKYLK